MATQLDRIEAALRRIDLQQQQQTALLTAIQIGNQIMSKTADDTAAEVTVLNAKVEQFIALVQPGVQALRDQLAAAQAQVASLIAGDTADATTLQVTLNDATAEVAKVDAAIAALTPAP